jgi:hypothetical protein
VKRSAETSLGPAMVTLFSLCLLSIGLSLTRAPHCKKEGLAPRSVRAETAQECHDVVALSGVGQIERMRRVGAAA